MGAILLTAPMFIIGFLVGALYGHYRATDGADIGVVFDMKAGKYLIKSNSAIDIRMLEEKKDEKHSVWNTVPTTD